MKHHRQYGPSIPEMGWVPAPSFLLRRDRILRLFNCLSPGLLLEVGCGAGTLLFELNQRGFRCEALETSPAALEIARHINANNVTFHHSAQSEWETRFDYLCAFEVLEHIEDDRKALAEWRSWLKPGGQLLISVPAHTKKWTASDIWAGHFRRYERHTLIELLEESGFVVEHFETYGFPLANLVGPLRAFIHNRKLKVRQSTFEDDRAYHSNLSGIARDTEVRLYPLLKTIPGRTLMYLACRLQKWSSGRDWGTGYIVLAKKVLSG